MTDDRKPESRPASEKRGESSDPARKKRRTREQREAAIDNALEESFPASDSPAYGNA